MTGRLIVAGAVMATAAAYRAGVRRGQRQGFGILRAFIGAPR